MEQRETSEPGDELHEAEPVHRGALGRPVHERLRQRVVDGAAMGLGGEGWEIDADRTADIEPMQRLGERLYGRERQGAWIEGAIDVDEQHGGSGTELKAPSRKCHLAGKRFGSQLRTVAGGELPNDPNFVAFGGE